MADISHYGGLVAANAMANPLDEGFDVITTTTHKSLRGPRGGLIVCQKDHAKVIDSSVFPGLQGGPHMNQVAAAAFTLLQAGGDEFAHYGRDVLGNAQSLARTLLEEEISLVTGGTENHLLVLNTVESFGLNGQQAQDLLDRVGITTNKQVIPDDPLPPFKGSGIRIGTPAATTRGMGEGDMRKIALWIASTLRNPDDNDLLRRIGGEVLEFCRGFPVPGLE